MRKIEQEMVQAVRDQRDWKQDNTEVIVDSVGWCQVYLHGNHIAMIDEFGRDYPNLNTFVQWPTVTTRSRLRALGCSVEYSNGCARINGDRVW